MDGAVLTHLERQRVKLEGVELPSQVLQLSIGDAVKPKVAQRDVDLFQLAGERRGVVVASRTAFARTPQAFRHVGEASTKRLVGKSGIQVGRDVGEITRVVNQPLAYRCGRVVRDGDRL